MSLLRRDMACQELVELVTAYFDGSLSRSDRKRLQAHLKPCEPCNAYLEQMRLTIAATGRLTEDDVSPEAADAMLHVFRDWQRERTA